MSIYDDCIHSKTVHIRGEEYTQVPYSRWGYCARCTNRAPLYPYMQVPPEASEGKIIFLCTWCRRSASGNRGKGNDRQA